MRIKLNFSKVSTISFFSFLIFLLTTCFALPGKVSALSSSLIDFNTATDLTNNFNPDAVPDFTNVATGGINNTGAVSVPLGSTDIWVTKQGYTISGAGAIYRFSAFFKIQANSGYGGLGFTPEISSTGDVTGSPATGLGVAFHGGGAYFVSSGAQTGVNWSPDLTLGNWYKIILEVKALGSNTYNLDLKIYNSDATGTVGTLKTEQTLNGVVNADVGGASIIHSYFSAAGSRVEYIDNFLLELDGGAAFISAGLPLVTTTSISGLTSSSVTTGGNMLTDQGVAVTAYGVCYNTTGTPTTADTCTNDGSGTGSFVSNLGSLTDSTIYYARAYATNATGTTYGGEVGFMTLPLVADATPPTDPVAAPDLQVASDAGSSSTDNVTNVSVPTFDVVCSEAGATINLYSDSPIASTLIGTKFCGVSGTTSITSSLLADGVHNITYTNVDPSGNASLPSPSLAVTINNAIPTLSEVTSVPTPTTNTTPSYTFSSTVAGTISYGGSCSSTTTSAVSGSNTINFSYLGSGTYSNCYLILTSMAGTASLPLSVTTFTVNAPALPTSFGGGPAGPFYPPVVTSTVSPTTETIFKYIGVDEQTKKISDDIVAKKSIEEIQKLSAEDINNLYFKPTEHSNLGLADCKPGFPIHAVYNKKNDPKKIKELQNFLNTQGENLLVTGLYHKDDVLAVKRFEKKYLLPELGVWDSNEHDVASAIACGFKITLKNLPKDTTACADTFVSNLRAGRRNDTSEVVKMQKFLEVELGVKFPSYGSFDSLTAKHVGAFQNKYKEQILTPIKQNNPTKIWAIQTRTQANKILCEK